MSLGVVVVEKLVFFVPLVVVVFAVPFPSCSSNANASSVVRRELNWSRWNVVQVDWAANVDLIITKALL